MTLLSSAVALANNVTQKLGLQADVTHYPFLSEDGEGKRNFSSAVPRKAIVNRKQKMVRTSDGQLVMCQAYLAFLDPTVVTLLDKIVLPDGFTGPILATEGFVDGSDGVILSEIYLG